VTVAPDQTGKGLGQKMINHLCRLAHDNGLKRMIVPVRPSEKCRFPLIKMQDYITWQRNDGYFFDKWLRIHQRMGGDILKIAPHSMRVIGTIADWEQWTNQQFPGTGMYIVKGALSPVIINHEKDEGIYIEPNVWMEHPL